MTTPDPQNPYDAGSQPPPLPSYPSASGPAYPPPGAGYPAAGYGQSPYGPVYGQFPKNNLGVWSLVLGLVGMFVCGIFTAIPAIVVGANAKRAVAAGEANNEGMATAGIILGWIQVALTLLSLVWLFVFGGFAVLMAIVNSSSTAG